MNRKESDLRTVLRLYSGRYRTPAILGALLAAVAALSAMGLLAVSGWFITATALAGLSTLTAAAFNVFGPSAAIRGLAMSRTAGRYGERVLTHDTTLGALADLRSRLFLAWSTPHQASKLFAHPARILFRLTTDVDALDGVYLRLGVPWLVGFLAIVLVSLLVSALNAWFALAVFAWLIMTTILITRWQVRASRRASLRQIVALERHRMQCIDLASGQADLIMAQRLNARVHAIEHTQQQLERADIDMARADTTAGFMQHISTAVMTTAAMWLAAQAWLAGQIDPPWAVLILLTCLAVQDPLTQLRLSVNQVSKTALALRRLGPSIRETHHDEVVLHPDEQSHAPSTHIKQSHDKLACELRHVTLQYDDTLEPVIRDLSLEIPRGQRVIVLGPSGSGKSTLLAAIAGEIKPRHGELICHEPSTRLTQFPQVLHETVGNNLRIAQPKATNEMLWEALEAAGLAKALRDQQQGLDTLLGEGGLGLSVGQQRRLTLARLLLADKPMWLLDEPSDGLDSDLANDVIHRLGEHAHGRTVVVATHLQREARLADRLLMLSEGRLVRDLHRSDPEFEKVVASLRPD